MKVVAASLFFIFLAAANLQATPLTLGLDTAYIDPSVTPEGTSPWLEATFEDISTNLVQLTMSASNLTSETLQFVSNFFFNVTDATGLGQLEFEAVSGGEASIFRGQNLREAGGARFFDIEFVFADSQFAPGDQYVYLISSIDPDPLLPITSESFSAVSFSSSAEADNFYSAALVGGIGDGLTSWVAAPDRDIPTPPPPSPVPEPATVLLLCTGLAGVGFFSKKKPLK
jgi:hypothetical protein